MPSPHGDDVDGKPTVAKHGVQLLDRAGPSRGRRVDVGRRLIRYVQLRAGAGKLPNGKQLVSAENLPGAPCAPDCGGGGRDLWDGLSGRPHLRRSGCESWRQHGGASGVTSTSCRIPALAPLLAHQSDNGGMLLDPFGRPLAGGPSSRQARGSRRRCVPGSKAQSSACQSRERLVVPAAATLVAGLASAALCLTAWDATVRRLPRACPSKTTSSKATPEWIQKHAPHYPNW